MIDKHLTGRLSRARGVIGRYPDPNERYIFEWTNVGDRPIHMLGVNRHLIVEWHIAGAMSSGRCFGHGSGGHRTPRTA